MTDELTDSLDALKRLCGVNSDTAQADQSQMKHGEYEQEESMQTLSWEDQQKARLATIAYLLLSLDKPVDEGKLVRLDDLFGLSEDSLLNKEQTIRECDEFVGMLPESADERYRLILEKIDEALDAKIGESYGFFMVPGQVFKNSSGKSFLWFLLNLVIDDENYAGNKQYLLKYLARFFDIEASVFTELEAAAKDLSVITRERTELEASEKPWREVVPVLERLKRRKDELWTTLNGYGISQSSEPVLTKTVGASSVELSFWDNLRMEASCLFDRLRYVDLPVFWAKLTA